MPSAASAKLEKQASSNQAESTDNNNANTPIRQALVIIEHKIRNLEKRKTKLESYRAIQASGKELSTDQRVAVSKYDEVTQSLEFARELSKQMVQLATIAEKEQRKQARREALLRAQAETAKIREVLTIQNILSHFTDASVRDDFLNGTNGASKLEENDLKILEKFYIDIQVSRQSTPEDTPFSVGAQKAAEYLSLTIDGRPKTYGETTFDNVRRILQSIQECGYLDRGGKVESVEEFQEEQENIEQAATENEEKPQSDVIIPSSDQPVETHVEIVNANIQQQAQQQQQQSVIPPVQSTVGQALPKFPTEAPSAAAVPAPAFPQQPQQPQPPLVSSQIPPQPPQLQRPVVPSPITASVAQAQVPAGAVAPTPTNPLHAAHFPPTTVRAVEQAYFKQHQYIQQMRPLAEVIGSGNFYFLQDSELDSPDLVPSGFTPNESQNPAPNIPQGNLPPQSPSSTTNLQAQNVIQQQPQQQQAPPPPPQQQQQQQQQQPQSVHQQQQPPQLPIPQPGIQQPKGQQPAPAPIPTQTFTNQSFPPIVPPPAIFPPGVQPADIPSSSPQMPVFTAPPMPIPQMVAQSAVVVSQSATAALVNVESQQQQQLQQHQPQQQQLQHQQTTVLAQASNPNLISGPSGANVPLPGFTAAAKFPANPPLGMHQVSNQMPSVGDKFEQIQPQPPTMNNETANLKKPDEMNDRTQDASGDWDTHETTQKPIITSSTKEVIETTNQWSNEVTNEKNEWNSSFDNQNESNTWNNNQSDSYGSRNNRSGFGGSNRASSGGGGGSRGIRGGNGPPQSSNGYRGRSNNSYQQQQNGRNTGVYFRGNNDNNGYYQNQNGGYSSGNKQDSGNSYGGSSNTSFRPRGGAGGPMSQSNRQQTGGNNRSGPPNSGSGAPSRGNANSNRPNVGMSNPGNRSARSSGNTGTYGNSRPPNTVRQQQQDVNA